MMLDDARMRAVLDPKLRGAIHLDAATRADPIRHFVLFSSAASLFGTPGQANYAAANGFLDAFAHWRRAQGRPALSVNWGPWADSGMAADASAEVKRLWSAMGIALMPPADAFAALDLVLGAGAAQAAVVNADWSRLGDWLSRTAAAGLVEDLAGPAAGASGPSPEWLALLARLKDTAPAGRKPLIVAHFQGRAAKVLGLPSAESCDPHTPLNELGLDSLMAVELTNQLSAASGVRLRVTQLFDHQTVDALAGFFLDELLDFGEVERDQAALAPRKAAEPKSEDILASILDVSDEEIEKRLEKLQAGL
jgi:acyl carrier protein